MDPRIAPRPALTKGDVKQIAQVGPPGDLTVS
jgi:hypothetical protein